MRVDLIEGTAWKMLLDHVVEAIKLVLRLPRLLEHYPVSWGRVENLLEHGVGDVRDQRDQG